MQVWSRRIQRGDIVIERGRRRKVLAVRQSRRGRDEVILVFDSGPAMRVSATKSLEVAL